MTKDVDPVDLTDFGARDSIPAPKIQKQTPITTTQVYPHTTVGFVGPIPQRSTFGLVKSVSRDEHRFHSLAEDDGGAYAISDDALRKAKNAGATRILIVEVDTESVYEWIVRQWDESVPKKYLADVEDPQTYAALDTADEWPGHAQDVYISSCVDIQSVTRDG